jgi:hypothetical protein
MTMKKPGYLSACVLFLMGILVLSSPVFAVSITQSPDQISRGERLTLSIRDLKNEDTFSLLIEGRFAVPSGSSFLFATDNFQMPISLTKGELIAYTENTKETKFQVQKGDTTVGFARETGPDGIFSYSEKRDVGSGTYDKMRITGTVLPGKTSILTRLQLLGSKSGPDNSDISFTVDGIDEGSIILTVLVNDKQELFKQVPLRPPVTATQPVSDQYIIVPASSRTPTVAIPLPEGPQTFSSVDGLASVTATGISYAGLLKIPPKDVPPDWILISSVYSIAPDSLVFSPDATLSFAIPVPQNPDTSYAYFIGMYNNGAWAMVPSTATATAIEAQIERAGAFALMAFRPESTISVPSAATAQGTKPTGTMTPGGAPKVASVAQASPTAAPTKAPLSWFVAACALVTGAGFVIRSKREK